MTLNELIYNIKNAGVGALSSDDVNLSNEQIVFWINTVRAKLIKERGEIKNIPFEFFQTLKCVPLELKDASQCPFEIKTDKHIRVTDTLPKTILLSNKIQTYIPYKKVTLIDSFNSIPYIKDILIKNMPALYAKRLAYSFKEDKVYVFCNLSLEKISIEGLFEDPREAAKYNTCDNLEEYDYDTEYPMPASYVSNLVEIVMNLYLNPYLQTKNLKDVGNNAQEKI